uniref:Ig-like domain-containing protein n=1 Tax=Acrobeloides nanus TaxID=290746 RepID=A0A914CX40_9BILA
VGAVQWIKNGYGLGSYREIPLFPRYSMVGSASLGEYNLRIVNISLEDDDVFECQIETAQENPGQISKPAKLNVIAEPQAPYFVGMDNSKPVTVVEGKAFELACRSDGGKPAAKLAWVISKDAGGREIINWLGNSAQILQNTKIPRNSKQFQYEAKVAESILLDEDSSLESIVSNLTFVPTQTEDGRYIICLATHDTYGGAVKHASVSMDVSYPPKATIRVDETRSLIRESDLGNRKSSDGRSFEQDQLSG